MTPVNQNLQFTQFPEYGEGGKPDIPVFLAHFVAVGVVAQAADGDHQADNSHRVRTELFPEAVCHDDYLIRLGRQMLPEAILGMVGAPPE